MLVPEIVTLLLGRKLKHGKIYMLLFYIELVKLQQD
jgi:hypothetical protein